MAYFMSFLALFLFTEILTAKIHQEHGPDIRLKKLEYENSSGEIALTTFFYNDEGRMVEAYWETLDGTRNSSNVYRNNDAGRISSCYREFSDDLTSYEIYLYDGQGKKIRETFLRSDGIYGTADLVYDEKDRCEKMICDHYKGWINGTIIYQHRPDGSPKKADIMRDGQAIGRIEFEYDKQGNLIRDTWTFASGWQQVFAYRYEKVK